MPIDTETRARIAANARWAREIAWNTIDLEEATLLLQDLYAECARAGEILQRRLGDKRENGTAECFNPSCRRKIDTSRGMWVGRVDRRDPATGLVHTEFACSAACQLYLKAVYTEHPAAKRNLSITSHPQDVPTKETSNG